MGCCWRCWGGIFWCGRGRWRSCRQSTVLAINYFLGTALFIAHALLCSRLRLLGLVLAFLGLIATFRSPLFIANLAGPVLRHLRKSSRWQEQGDDGPCIDNSLLQHNHVGTPFCIPFPSSNAKCPNSTISGSTKSR